MPTSTDIGYIKLCNSHAKKWLEKGNYPCVSIIAKGNKIVSKAKSCETSKYDVTGHAEMLAIGRACRKLKTNDLSKYTLYSNIEPCLMCAKAIVYANIRKVVYGANHNEYGSKRTFRMLKANGIGNNIRLITGVESKKAREMLKEWLEIWVRS